MSYFLDICGCILRSPKKSWFHAVLQLTTKINFRTDLHLPCTSLRITRSGNCFNLAVRLCLTSMRSNGVRKTSFCCQCPLGVSQKADWYLKFQHYAHFFSRNFRGRGGLLACAIDRYGSIQSVCRPKIRSEALKVLITINDTIVIGCRQSWYCSRSRSTVTSACMATDCLGP